MKRMLAVILAGVFCGTAAHFAWFAARRPARADGLDAELGWIQESLQLSPAQFARIKALHEASGPRLRELATQLAQMRREFAQFEHEQKVTEDVDFVEFARYVQKRRAVDRECLESTRQLVLAASREMDPVQRERYRALMAPALEAGGSDRLD